MMSAEGTSGPGAELDAVCLQLADLGDWRSVVQLKAQSGTAWLSSKRFDIFDLRYQEAFELASAHGLIYLELLVRLQKAQFQLNSAAAGRIVDSIAAEARAKRSELAQRIDRATGDAISTCDSVDVLLDHPEPGGTSLVAAADAAARAAASFELQETNGLLNDWRLGKANPPFGPEAISELRRLSARLRAELEQRRAALSTQADLIRAALKSVFGDCDSPIEILTRAVAKAETLPSSIVQVYMALADAYCARAAISKTNSPQAAAADLEQAEQAAVNAAAAAKNLANEAEKEAPIAKLNEVRALRHPENSSAPPMPSGFYGDVAIRQAAIQALVETRPADALALLDRITGHQNSGAFAAFGVGPILGIRAAANYELGRYEDALSDLDSRIVELERQSEADADELSYALDHRLEELQNLCLIKACALTKLNRLVEAWSASERGRAAGPGNGVNATAHPPVEWTVWRAWLRTERAAFVSIGLGHWGALIFSAAPDDDQLSATLLPSFLYADMARRLLTGAREDSQVGTGEDSQAWTGIIFGAVPELSAKLIHPIEPLLERLAARAEVIYILPDSYLFRVPFAALTLGGERYLNDLCPLAMAPSAAFVLANAGRAREQARSCLALGVGQAPRDKPVARFAEQARAVADLWAAPSTCETLLDDDATAAALRQAAGSVDVLHLACHGATSSEVHDPMDASRLELADGTVTAREALAWSLRANLVFMNVCQGGRFRMEGRTNVSGFIRAFHAAGACSVISSVTHIDPLPASELAVRFYRHWFTGVSKARALQRARQEVRQLYPAANDWASHAITGDYR
jgi:hypothetical protein